MSQSVTLRDVAREAGLSVAAASHALNGSPGVSEATRRRVIEISERLGYRPRHRSRSRSSQGRAPLNMRLVLLDGGVGMRYFNHWVAAITHVAQRYEMRLDLRQIQETSANWEIELRQHARDVDGLLIHGYVWTELVHVIKQLRIPVVVAGDAQSQFVRPRHQVTLDAWGMSVFATQTLLDAGHERIGFFCPQFPPGGWFDQWLSGYQLTMLRSTVGYDPSLCRVLEDDGRYDLGVRAAEYMASLDDPPTAYVVAEVSRAASFQQALASRGIELRPDNLVLGGEPTLLKDYGLSGYPVLTENAEDCAVHALQWLIHLTNGESVPGCLTVPFRAENFEQLKRRSKESHPEHSVSLS